MSSRPAVSLDVVIKLCVCAYVCDSARILHSTRHSAPPHHTFDGSVQFARSSPEFTDAKETVSAKGWLPYFADSHNRIARFASRHLGGSGKRSGRQIRNAFRENPLVLLLIQTMPKETARRLVFKTEKVDDMHALIHHISGDDIHSEQAAWSELWDAVFTAICDGDSNETDTITTNFPYLYDELSQIKSLSEIGPDNLTYEFKRDFKTDFIHFWYVTIESKGTQLVEAMNMARERRNRLIGIDIDVRIAALLAFNQKDWTQAPKVSLIDFTLQHRDEYKHRIDEARTSMWHGELKKDVKRITDSELVALISETVPDLEVIDTFIRVWFAVQKQKRLVNINKAILWVVLLCSSLNADYSSALAVCNDLLF
eukprot:TRINITY_DN24829_c1_g2_i1.p1 TRINITY_DN24829_c1_g2~~TRINITY_DN24829_c1_g2_i1.p1  ORF type:complete len:369 (-),score=20.19 TRINITY_DN24829_c1_g2_i1:235-1341(-)